ncbi:MAG TPA: c-type cytochrome [Rhodocyclaceae bacterium]|nr:c-type cytochrome [Rhodocyclaceae bacterium]
MSSRIIPLLSLWLALALPGPVLASDARALVERASADPQLHASLAESGKKAAAFCMNCHGETGNSTLPDVPNLAGQHPAYVLDQIEAFLAGRRKNDFMQGLMKVLSEEEKATIALFFASAEPVPAVAQAGPKARDGAAHFTELCARCHRADAGGEASFPRLAGQQPEYLRLSLKRYLDMSGERLYPPMTGAVRTLGADRIDAVVDYLSSMH